MNKSPALALCLIFVLSGCSFALEKVGLYQDKAPVPNLDDVIDFKADETEITFTVVFERSLKVCAQCHQETYASAERVLANQEAVLDRVQTNSMPPRAQGYAPLTDCQKQILETWLDDQRQGRTVLTKIKDLPACSGEKTLPAPAPLPSETPTETPTPPVESVDYATLEVNFENLTKYILKDSCLDCHVPGKTRGTLLDSVSAIQGQELISRPAESSTLYKVVVPGMHKLFMPPPWSRKPALTEAQVDYLKRWIETVPPSEWDF